MAGGEWITPATAAAGTARSVEAKKRKPPGVDPATSEVEYTPAEWQFLATVAAYKARTGRQFPTLRELYLILTRDLGYRRPEDA